MYATHMQTERVFIMGDAAHRHPPSNGLGSNTSIQDGYNLAWKLAHVIKGTAGPGLLRSYSEERAPVAKQIVTRANQSIAEFGPIFEALGMTGTVDPVKMQQNMDKRCNSDTAAETQREALRKAIAFKKYEFDCHGVEMNQRYDSGAVVRDGHPDPGFPRDAELHYQPTTWPGARIPHCWLFREDGSKVSTLDLCGKGRWTIFTGIGGEAWTRAAETVGREMGVDIAVHVVGPRMAVQDHLGDWARIRDTGDSGAVMTRPDQHVCYRAATLAADPEAELRRVLSAILQPQSRAAAAAE
jgi:2,4-dichlorophenol 6-monooxygenase